MKYLVLAAGLIFTLIGCSNGGPSKEPAPGTQTAVDIVAGRTIAERDCKGCHGLDGRGAAPAIPDLAAQQDRYLLEAIAAYREGRRTHAALRDMVGHLSEADIRNVVGYYSGLSPLAAMPGETVTIFQPYENGRTLASACAKCHGADGNSTIPGVPSLAGQQLRYFVVAVQEYLNGVRKTDPMHSLLRPLSKLDEESLALYFASQLPAQRPAAPFGDPAAGEPLTAVCGGCHGPHGVSTDAATPNLAGQDARYLVMAIKSYSRTRRHEGMQAFVGDLSQHDVEDIAAFYSVQASRPAEIGQTVVQELIDKCDRCHGAGVQNASMAVPFIRGQDKDYLIMALRAYRDDRRASSMMHNMSLPYSDSIIESVASFYASQPASKR